MSIMHAVMGCIAAAASESNAIAEPMSGADTVITTPFDPTGTAYASVRWNSPSDGGPGWAGYTGAFVGPFTYKWLRSGDPADYEILFTQSGGSAVTGSPLNTRLSLGSAQSLALSVTATSQTVIRTANGSYQIYRASTGQVVAASTWSLYAEVHYAAG